MKLSILNTLLIAFTFSPLVNADNWQPMTGADTLQQLVSGATAEIELQPGVTAVGKYHADGTAVIEAWKLGLQYWHYVKAPDNFGPDYQVRFSVSPVVKLPW